MDLEATLDRSRGSSASAWSHCMKFEHALALHGFPRPLYQAVDVWIFDVDSSPSPHHPLLTELLTLVKEKLKKTHTAPHTTASFRCKRAFDAVTHEYGLA